MLSFSIFSPRIAHEGYKGTVRSERGGHSELFAGDTQAYGSDQGALAHHCHQQVGLLFLETFFNLPFTFAHCDLAIDN